MNQKLAHLFYQLAEYLEMNEVAFKPQAYLRVALNIENMPEDLEEIYRQKGAGGLKDLPGIGQGIAEKIEEFIKTGRIGELEKLRRQTPVDIEALTKIEGIGPKTIRTLYKELGVKNVADLEKAAKSQKIRQLEGFGAKTEENILSAVRFSRQDADRFLLGFIWPAVEEVKNKLAKVPGVRRVEVAGSLRRRQETVGDIDLLAVSSQPQKLIDFFTSLPNVEKIYGQGQTKANVRLDWGIDADLRVVPPKSFGAALQYFTGNKDHNIALRKIAIQRGYKLNEYGVFALGAKKEENLVTGESEKDIYNFLGLQYLPPEARENTGEIELAQANKFPRLVGYGDVLGDLQMHTRWSDGAYSILEMAQAAKKLGRQYILITDHAGRLEIAGGLKEADLQKQMVEIETADKKISGLKILKGAEVDIDKDGRLHIDDATLSRLDIVLGSIHSGFKINKQEMTRRVCQAMQSPHLDVWAHPSGRLLQRREGYQVDWGEIFRAAKKTNTAIEINAYPERLDLSWPKVKDAIAAGVKLTIGTDSHSIDHLKYLDLGVSVARRGWAAKKDILNCLSWQDLLKYFRK
ncbi:MAG: DNA polymerase III [Candidatus Portnoybacteria bacterium CG10_big_fil_rev_8_21_14_0_10_44_7]|uniref:DNA polymerase beta n=1 Tax=Candidatus Portnoybacteria bacterium CG10_big_fil_rev_8_21_14_0_10_44_7 TaxID=1974816 RepID=A0A2M8KJB3_9BACT|nr:MAG: DNA polymerase III [Candidatus Portnoybacteria bacterium CG10_big_fil_rev_8_21_14_0_10_44_7]